MPALLSFALIVGLGSSPLEPGTWLPTSGPAGVRAVLAIAYGGDGALYAAGEGWVWRMDPGQAWTPVGWFVPQLSWDQGQGFDASGPFPPEFLQRVEDDLQQALEARLGIEPEGTEVSEDLVRDLVEAYTGETDPRPDSPYAVAGMVPAADGVWLATGGGLFKIDRNGVNGPVARIWPILDLTVSGDTVVVAAPGGVYRVDAGAVTLWRQFDATGLAQVDGRAAFIANAETWWDDGQVGPRRLAPPTGVPRTIASGGDVLWVGTDMAVYRRDAEGWSLCARLPETPHRLVSDGAVLVAVAEQAIYATDRGCASWRPHPAPWLGGLSFTAAAFSPAGLWGATTEGVFLLAPRDPDLAVDISAEGLQRKLRQLPSLDMVMKAALVELALDPATNGYGSRPAWRNLLPEVRLTAMTRPRRGERSPTFLGGTPQLETLPPRAELRVVALWKVSFDFLTLLLDGDPDAGLDDVSGGDSLFDAAAPEDPDLRAEDLREDLGQDALISVGHDDVEAGLGEDTVLSLVVAERNQLRRARGKLFSDLRRLYKERLRLMYRMHVTRADRIDVNDHLRLRELDARLDVYTGGAWSQAPRRSPDGGL